MRGVGGGGRGPVSRCAACGKELESDEIAITRKLVNRGCDSFYCVPCLAARFSISEEDVRALIERFKAAGCSLFY